MEKGSFDLGAFGGSGSGGNGASKEFGRSSAETNIIGRDYNSAPSLPAWVPYAAIGGVGLLLFIGVLSLIKR